MYIIQCFTTHYFITFLYFYKNIIPRITKERWGKSYQSVFPSRCWSPTSSSFDPSDSLELDASGSKRYGTMFCWCSSSSSSKDDISNDMCKSISDEESELTLLSSTVAISKQQWADVTAIIFVFIAKPEMVLINFEQVQNFTTLKRYNSLIIEYSIK